VRGPQYRQQVNFVLAIRFYDEISVHGKGVGLRSATRPRTTTGFFGSCSAVGLNAFAARTEKWAKVIKFANIKPE
jgi:hypothetical protein